MDQLTQALAWLHAHFVVALLIFLPLSLVATEVFRKRPPAEDAALKAAHPKLIAARELLRGLGWDGPKIRMALSVLLLGKAWDPLAVLDKGEVEVPPVEVPPDTLRGGRIDVSDLEALLEKAKQK